jgi:hypothetical protein
MPLTILFAGWQIRESILCAAELKETVSMKE